MNSNLKEGLLGTGGTDEKYHSVEMQDHGPADSRTTVMPNVADELKSLEEAEIGYVVKTLHTSPHYGLRGTQVDHRLELFGMNAIEEKKVNPFLKFLTYMWNPLSWVMEIAALVAIIVSNGGGLPPDWQDFVGIVILLILNASLGYWEESQAGNAVAELLKALAPEARVKRDGEWKKIEAKYLVPGDIIAFKLGDIMPADCKVFIGENIKIDQAALTGEALPVSKKVGDFCYSGSTCKMGEGEAIVVATGIFSFFGRAANLVEQTDETNRLNEVLTKIGLFCIVFIVVFEIVIIIIMYAKYGYNYRRGIDNVLVLLIGGVPIAMPTVLSVTLALGAHGLAKKKAVVTRITAIEELAGMDVLCSDKTGTLTKNKLEISTSKIVKFKEEYDVILFASRASRTENQDAIDFAIVNQLRDNKKARAGIKEKHFAPFDPISKRSTITYIDESNGKTYRVSKGAPQVILSLCWNKDQLKDTIDKCVEDFGKGGYRSLGVSIAEVPDGTLGEELPDLKWEYIGMIPMFDPPRDDSAETIEKALAKGVRVKMITGDHLTIARETCKLLRMGTNIYNTEVLNKADDQFGEEQLANLIEKADGFAGVFPEHKYKIVKILKQKGHITGMTGDGVNDAPALKVANIGVAVSDATDAARSAADIVLTEAGLGVIIDAIIESRKIFQRMKNYAIYACATTVRVILTFAILIFAFEYDQPPFLILIMAFVNDGTMLTISKDLVNPSEMPDAWRLPSIFSTAIALGTYLSLSTLIFYHIMVNTDFFNGTFGLPAPWRVDPALYKGTGGSSNGVDGTDPHNDWILHSLIFLQVAISGQSMIFSTRAQTYWFLEKPGNWVIAAFLIAQLITSLIAAFGDTAFTKIAPAGRWVGVAWIWCIIWHIPIDLVKKVGRWFAEPTSWQWNTGAEIKIKDRNTVRMTQQDARNQMNQKLQVLRNTQLG